MSTVQVLQEKFRSIEYNLYTLGGMVADLKWDVDRDNPDAIRGGREYMRIMRKISNAEKRIEALEGEREAIRGTTPRVVIPPAQTAPTE